MNPHCLKPDDRCLTTRTLHSHPSDCSPFYYPADEIINKHWSQLDKYPVDNLGKAVRKKVEMQKGNESYLSKAIDQLRKKMQASLREA